MEFLTHDKIRVRSGSLVWYVNYFGQIVPVVLNKKMKSTVKYFSLCENARAWLAEAEEKIKNNPKIRLSQLIKEKD
jgi:hypothetical protein